ncbi:N-acetylmuramic acid 6-phosphate etherase [Smittium culicis]|uniref:N-acetyl-D-glucosamine kinase n=1 Tax=Smittium culicis TaxID=133412 RepID=A0A1R1Y1J1_9FUNG|nr:N-acetylmuramic acid 6-phosphate etherase [Smittium culicis]
MSAKGDFFSVIDSLKTESRNPNSMNIDKVSTIDMLKIINNEDKTIASTVESILDNIALAVDKITERMLKGGRILYFGAGTSGRLGVLDASECPPTYSTNPDLVVAIMAGGDAAIRNAQENVEDSVPTGQKDCKDQNITPNDIVVGIAASGRTPYVIGAVMHAKEAGALTIGVTTNSKSSLNDYVDVLLAAEVGPEVVTGSTRMKSGTAQKMILNMLTTGAMIKLGKTYSNLMVDFRPTNEKLRLRAPKIVRETTGISLEEARDAVARCGGEVKIAIMTILAKTDPENAKKLLDQNGGVLAKAIDSIKSSNSQPDSSSNDQPKVESFLAIDGGGTKTAVLIVDSNNNTIGSSEVGSTNVSSVPVDIVHQRIVDGIEKAKNGRTDLFFKKAWLGLAGIGNKEKRDQLFDLLQGLSPSLQITPDINLILSSLPKFSTDSLSVAVISGTGSVALCELPDGSFDICGGWGPVLGDQGSGLTLGTRCIKAVSLDIEKAGPSTQMTKFVCEKWGVQTRIEFIKYIQSIPTDQQRREIASLAKIVLDCAYQLDDQVALEIANSEAINLSNFVVSLLVRNNAKSANIAVTGSVIVKCDQYRNLFLQNIESKGFKVNVLKSVDSPSQEAAKFLSSSL